MLFEGSGDAEPTERWLPLSDLLRRGLLRIPSASSLAKHLSAARPPAASTSAAAELDIEKLLEVASRDCKGDSKGDSKGSP